MADPMNERIEAFLAYLEGERSLSPNTISAYRNDLLQFAEYLRAEAGRQGGTDFAVSTIDRDLITTYFLHLRDRGYSAASIARKTAALRSFFQYLRRKGEVNADPTQGIGSPDVKKPLPKTVQDDQVNALMTFLGIRQTPEGIRDHAMLRLLSATGMRVGELVMVDVEDVDFSNGRVRVVGRGNRERSLPLDEVTLDSIRVYLDQARPFLTRNAPQETALVVNQRGLRLTRQGFWLIMKGLVREAGLPAIMTPHMLRHSFATHQIGEGLGLEELRQLLGHASIATTQIYTQLASSQNAQDEDSELALSSS
ncbi:MAG: tyrosine-type recombinase/integrase [Chloroflexi bacterium]|nr:tyrosine-type recombinase/integrase [Chloroflexota bacterium]MBV9893918.1 tyrosine-type recombinase/integrase [Chloroflexota bacterium]